MVFLSIRRAQNILKRFKCRYTRNTLDDGDFNEKMDKDRDWGRQRVHLIYVHRIGKAKGEKRYDYSKDDFLTILNRNRKNQDLDQEVKEQFNDGFNEKMVTQIDHNILYRNYFNLLKPTNEKQDQLTQKYRLVSHSLFWYDIFEDTIL